MHDEGIRVAEILRAQGSIGRIEGVVGDDGPVRVDAVAGGAQVAAHEGQGLAGVGLHAAAAGVGLVLLSLGDEGEADARQHHRTDGGAHQQLQQRETSRANRLAHGSELQGGSGSPVIWVTSYFTAQVFTCFIPPPGAGKRTMMRMRSWSIWS